MRRIGLTGGIGSGKSTIATQFAKMGIPVVDADAISRQLTGPDGEALVAIKDNFGAEFIHPIQGLQRAKMRDLIFANPLAKTQLEQLLHPLIQAEMDRQCHTHEQTGALLCILEIPLLVESNIWRTRLDHVLVVHCPPQVQLNRVILRSKISLRSAQSIINAQVEPMKRLLAADSVIHNDENVTLAQIEQQVQKWLQIHAIMND